MQVLLVASDVQRHVARRPGRDGAEQRRLRRVLGVLRIRELAPDVEAARRVAIDAADANQRLVGRETWRHAADERGHQDEQGRVEADAQRQHDDHRERRDGPARELAKPEADIGGERLEAAAAAGVARLLAEDAQVAELPPRRALRLLAGHALRHQALHRSSEMIGHLVAHLALETTAEEQRAQPGPEAIQHGYVPWKARSGHTQDGGQRAGESRPFLPLVVQLPLAGCRRRVDLGAPAAVGVPPRRANQPALLQPVKGRVERAGVDA